MLDDAILGFVRENSKGEEMTFQVHPQVVVAVVTHRFIADYDSVVDQVRDAVFPVYLVDGVAYDGRDADFDSATSYGGADWDEASAYDNHEATVF